MTMANPSREALHPCGECGMPCSPGEFHPYAACLMFKACKSSVVVRANLNALAAHEAGCVMVPDDWRPIETAPKDGTRIILGNEHGTWVGEFVAVYGSGYVPSEPWHSAMLNVRHMPRGCSLIPTHWMPLPAAPKEPT